MSEALTVLATQIQSAQPAAVLGFDIAFGELT